MSEKKVVSRSVAITLGALCIVFVIAIAGMFVNYNAMLQDKDSQIIALNTKIVNLGGDPEQTTITSDKDVIIADLQSQISDLQKQKESLENQISQKNSEIDRLNGIISQKNSEISQKESEISSLNSQISQKNSEINSLNSQIASLNSQIDDLEAAKVIKVGLVGTDERPFLQTPYLHVEGFVCNVGINTAYNVRLHVVAYQSGVVAIDTYINIGSVSGELWTAVNSNIYYEFASPALTGWIITPEWT